MSNKKKILYIVLLSLAGLTAAFVFIYPLQFGICQSTYTWGTEIRCSDRTDNTIGGPLLTFSSVLIIISLILFFTSDSVFNSWWRFAKYYLPIAAVLILLSSGRSGGGWGVSINFDTELTTWFLVGIFFAVSVGIIAYQSWKRR